MSVGPEHSQSLRLCLITKWEHFDGYGFNLHAEKGKHGQFVGKVDEDSPAETAGLKEGDRIIEVNGKNVTDENHKEVVQRIKAVSEWTELLVVDPAGDAYFKASNIELNSSLPFVVRKKTPTPNHIHQAESQPDAKTPAQPTYPSSTHEKQNMNKTKAEEVITSKPVSKPEQVNVETTHNSLNLNMTARELRAQLAARKKYDPKKDCSLDVKKKYDIVQKL